MSNPFATTPAADSEAAEKSAASVFETAPETEEVELDAEDDPSYGKFEDPEPALPEKGKPLPGVQKRISKLVGERNELRETLAEREVRLAAAEARAETLAELNDVVNAHYAANPSLLDFDARFMTTFDTLAKTNPQLAQAAAIVKAAMEGKESPMTTTPEITEVAEAASNPVLDKIVARDVNRTVAEVLGEHDVKPFFVKAIATDMLNVLTPEELADLTPEDVVECAKVYASENDIPMTEFLAPKKGAAKPPATTAGRGTPARSAAPETPESAERAKPKSVEEWQANRDKRFKALTRDLGF